MDLSIARFSVHDIAVVVVLGGAACNEMAADARQRLYEAVRKSAGRDIAFVWPDAIGRTKCIGPPQQVRFFESVRYDQLLAQADGFITVSPG